MSLLQDIFNNHNHDDDDDNNEPQEDIQYERIQDNGDDDINGDYQNNMNTDSDKEHSQAEEDKPKRVDPPGEKKVKIIKNPRAVLNPKRLTGPRGIQTIEEFFKDFQFQGKGQEVEDLNMMMKKLEHWAHRLYPKFQFDDCLEKIAALGAKKEVVTHIKRIRMNLIQLDVPIVNQSDSEDEEGNRGPILDEFDLLLDQQIALARSTPALNMKTVVQYDDSVMDQSEHPQTDPKDTSTAFVTPAKPTASLTEDQVARMMKNRLLAEERRLARLKAAHEQEKNASVPMDTEEISEHLQNALDQNTEDIVDQLN